MGIYGEIIIDTGKKASNRLSTLCLSLHLLSLTVSCSQELRGCPREQLIILLYRTQWSENPNIAHSLLLVAWMVELGLVQCSAPQIHLAKGALKVI